MQIRYYKKNGKFQVIQPNIKKISLERQEESKRRIGFETLEEMTSCFFFDSLTEQQKEEIKKHRGEKWINLFEKCAVLNLMDEEIENAKQSIDKMKLLSESSACICIDTSKMEYVEENIESNNR